MDRKTEYILALIGSIISALISGLMILFSAIMAFSLSATNALNTGDDYYYDTYSSAADYSNTDAKIGLAFFVIITVFCIGMTILGFIGSFKIKNNKQGWGIVVLILGIFSIASFQGILWLIAGIMMLSRKTPAPIKTASGQSTTLLDDMEQLKKLRDQGIISEEEYQIKKNEWIDF
ncbi:DUF4064 domain-containing protein [Carnobacterium gallinarum]|uniref:DUF4064 domain-containing protein n=1 Tax=Carnobacterium gallinarum TaxID=2749 RepID=UPI00054F4275|nr:DUF4064 domain-containing protein [Carnobacterium gallinarum]